MTNLVGKTINNYFFEETLGSGSFGAVYKVVKNGTVYAAKVLAEAYILEEFKKEDNRITRELDILKKTVGDKLIKYMDDFSFINEFNSKEYVIIMEFAHGITLRKFMENTTDIALLQKVFCNVLEGVRQLHNTKFENEGIIHRDLKPDNIMIDSKMQIKIIDFGLSKVIDFSSITSTGSQIGSPLYMSPEQLRDSKHIDYRSDIYALGIILYEMLTKKRPYVASTLPELMLKILNEPIVPPRQHNSQIDDKIESIIYKATSKEMFARYQTIEEFLAAFDESETQSALALTGKYYAWIYKEFDVTEKFEIINTADIIYPLHVKNWMKGLFKYFSNRGFKNVIVDPSTQRLSYFAFANTKGLRELPYAPDNGVISLDVLQNPIYRENYINKWYEAVNNMPNIILPYHYISNTDYPVDKIEDWIKINVQLINECILRISDKHIKYGMISIGLGHLVFQSEKILSYYVHTNVDQWIVQVSDMKGLNEQSLKSFIQFMRNLQKYTNKPVIALKVPISLGLVLLAYGIHGFSLGPAGIDYFDEQYIKEEKDAFNLYSKFYFPQVLSFMTYPKKEPYAFKELFDYFGGCECCWCAGKDAIEIATGDKCIQLHHWQLMIKEVEILNSLDASEKLLYIKKRVEEAIENYDKISRDISNQRNSDNYKLLKNLSKVI